MFFLMNKGILTSFLYRHLSLEDEDSSRSFDSHIHVSDLYDLCFRQRLLSQRLRIPIVKQADAGTKWRWTLGRAVESTLREKFKEIGQFSETEVELRDNNLKIQGHADGRMGNEQLVEIKGMDQALFKFTARFPLPKHRFQLETYLALDNNSKSGILFSATWSQDKIPWRDTTVNFNEKSWEITRKTVSEFREAEAGGQLPGRICQSQEDKRAILCPVRHECFSLSNSKNMMTIGERLKK